MIGEEKNGVHSAAVPGIADPGGAAPTVAPRAADGTMAESDETRSSDPDIRARLMKQFEQWLDETLADEPPPRGIPADILSHAATGESDPAGDADLYSLFSALTGLTGEIRLQGRAFKQLSDAVAPLAGAAPALRELQDAQHQSTQTIAAALGELMEKSSSPTFAVDRVCSMMIDLYDRLGRGLQTCRQGIEAIHARQPSGTMWRFSGGPKFARHAADSTEALRDACALMLARLQSSMQELGIVRIGNPGEPFDPQRMAAVDVRTDGSAAPGAVVEVLRSGYAINGQVQSPARVAVAKASAEPSADK